MMFDNKQYVPCLRWKQGEYQAVLQLSDTVKKTLTPLIEIPEMGWDFEEEKFKKTIDEHLAPFAKRIHDKWGKFPCFIDTKLISDYRRMENGKHPAAFIFDKLQKMKCLAIPVTSIDRDEIYQKEVKNILTNNKSAGICFRITIEQAAKSTFKSSLDSLLAELKVKASESNFILDLVTPNFVPLDGFAKLIQAIISRLPYLTNWCTFSIIGTSFPETMGSIKKGLIVVPRNEWQLYKKLINNFMKTNLRLPSFGDYSISHPNVLQMDMRIVKPSATIRYTIDDSWCIVKGTSFRDNPSQYYELSRNLVESHYYCGPKFSFGDEHIKKCAEKKVNAGNLPRWRQVGMNHHIEKVSRDIANFYASLKSP